MAVTRFLERRSVSRAQREVSHVRALALKQSPPANLGGALANPTSGISFRQDARSRQAYSFFKNWVYVATNAVAKRLAGQPYMAGELEGASANPERRYPTATKNRLPNKLKHAAEQGNLTVLDDHPVLDVFDRPNDVQRSFEFTYLSAINLLITGEAYWIGGVVPAEDGGDGRLEIWSVPTNWVKPKHEGKLFSSFDLEIGSVKIPDIPAENVARTYFPHPQDLRLAWSPLYAVHEAAAIDEHIIRSQKQSFERGIFPNVVITVGRNKGPDGKLTDSRPVLSGHHRRQLIASINQIWNGTVNAGDPAIIDGLIDSVHKLQNTPQEMNWLESGEQTKRRIMQVYQVNPISVGEIVGANRAQATESERQVCAQAVNPLAEAFSKTATDFAGPMYESPQRLQVWIEKAEPIDMELELKRWSTARQHDDVSTDEFRANVLNLAPDERPPKGALLKLPGGVTGAVNIMAQVGLGRMPREVAANLFSLFFDIEQEEANRIVGVGLPEIQPQPQPNFGSQNDDNEDDDDNDSQEPPDEESVTLEDLQAKLCGQHEQLVVFGQTLISSVEHLLQRHESQMLQVRNDSTDSTGGKL